MFYHTSFSISWFDGIEEKYALKALRIKIPKTILQKYMQSAFKIARKFNPNSNILFQVWWTSQDLQYRKPREQGFDMGQKRWFKMLPQVLSRRLQKYYCCCNCCMNYNIFCNPQTKKNYNFLLKNNNKHC